MHQVQLEGLPTQLRKQEKENVFLEQGKKQKLLQRLLPCEGHRSLQQMRQSREDIIVTHEEGLKYCRGPRKNVNHANYTCGAFTSNRPKPSMGREKQNGSQ